MRHTSRRLLTVPMVLLLATLVRPAPAPAQEELPADLGVVVRYTMFDDAPGFDDAVGIGGRAMAFFHPRWGLEVDGIYTSTDGPAAYWPDVAVFTAHGRVLHGIPVSSSGTSHLLLGLGFAHNRYGKDPSWQDTGVGALVGLRLGVSHHWSVRFDATYDFLPDSGEIDDFGHLGLQAGIGYNPRWTGPKRP